MHLVFLSIVLLLICIVLCIFQNKILFKLNVRLHFIVDADSVVFNWNLQEQKTSIDSLRQMKVCMDAGNTSIN